MKVAETPRAVDPGSDRRGGPHSGRTRVVPADHRPDRQSARPASLRCRLGGQRGHGLRQRINQNRIVRLKRGQASIPGPTIEMTEGECIAITLKNRSTKRASLHAHGVDYTAASDGTRLTRSCVRPGRDRTYMWQAHTESLREDDSVEPGSAGYWHYHDHCRMGEHGTRGIYAGMFGALIVRALNDPVPDVEPCVLVMIGTTFAFKRAPNTPLCEANLGQHAEFVVITHGDEFHTFHLHGHRWADTRSGSLRSPNDPSPIIDNKTIGPADASGSRSSRANA